MVKNIFVNIPVRDLNKSMDFFKKLGWSFNPQFTNDMGACLVINDNIFAMLLTEDFFKSFTKKEINDRSKTADVILAFGVEAINDVDDIMYRAKEAGALITKEAVEENGMYGGSFEDLDGHLWEIFCMG